MKTSLKIPKIEGQPIQRQNENQ